MERLERVAPVFVLLLVLIGMAVMAIVLTSPPGVEPITPSEAKTQIRIDHADEDPYIESLITVARQEAERIAWRQYITATWKLLLDRFPKRDFPIYVPRPPLQSVSQIQYVDQNGATQTLDAAKYTVDADSEPGRITPAFGETWPLTRKQIHAVTVTFVAGYGAAASDVPEPPKHWMKLHIAHWYEHREMAEGRSMTILPLAEGLLDPIRDERIVSFV